MTISVALCTYNGAAYIREQLESILSQILPVDEIVVCDDHSQDDTLAIVKEIAPQHPEVNWNIRLNNQSLGVVNNFAQAIGLCSGDVILLSDQDDFWLPQKTQVIVRWFQRHRKKNVVFTNASFIDENHNVYAKGKDLFYAVGFNYKARLFFRFGFALELFLKNNRATGATMAIKKEAPLSVQSIPEHFAYHDEIICFAAIEKNSLGYINKILTEYRIHHHQACGLGTWISHPPKADNAFSPIILNSGMISYIHNPGLLRRVQLMFLRYNVLADDTRKPSNLSNLVLMQYIRAYRFWGVLIYIRDILAFCKRKLF